jgi:hypothetical protein
MAHHQAWSSGPLSGRNHLSPTTHGAYHLATDGRGTQWRVEVAKRIVSPAAGRSPHHVTTTPGSAISTSRAPAATGWSVQLRQPSGGARSPPTGKFSFSSRAFEAGSLSPPDEPCAPASPAGSSSPRAGGWQPVARSLGTDLEGSRSSGAATSAVATTTTTTTTTTKTAPGSAGRALSPPPLPTPYADHRRHGARRTPSPQSRRQFTRSPEQTASGILPDVASHTGIHPSVGYADLRPHGKSIFAEHLRQPSKAGILPETPSTPAIFPDGPVDSRSSMRDQGLRGLRQAVRVLPEGTALPLPFVEKLRVQPAPLCRPSTPPCADPEIEDNWKHNLTRAALLSGAHGDRGAAPATAGLVQGASVACGATRVVESIAELAPYDTAELDTAARRARARSPSPSTIGGTHGLQSSVEAQRRVDERVRVHALERMHQSAASAAHQCRHEPCERPDRNLTGSPAGLEPRATPLGKMRGRAHSPQRGRATVPPYACHEPPHATTSEPNSGAETVVTPLDLKPGCRHASRQPMSPSRERFIADVYGAPGFASSSAPVNKPSSGAAQPRAVTSPSRARYHANFSSRVPWA